MSNDQKRSIGFQIAKARAVRGLTQEQLAELIGRSVEAVSNLERGKSFPGFETLVSLSKHLSVPMRDFFEVGPPPGTARAQLTIRMTSLAAELPDDILALAIEQLEALYRWQKER